MILAILQARVSSTRLPGKVLKTILGMPMLLRQIERIKRSKMMDTLLIATSVDPTDDYLEDLCRDNDLECFRGSLNDVLDRFYRAAVPFKPDHIVRLTGDCPLTDPELIDEVISFHLEGGYDYTSNAVEPTYPDGLDVEVISYASLRLVWQEAILPSHREHVTPFVLQHPKRFSIGSYRSASDLSHLRWTVDEPADFKLISRIYEALYTHNPAFSTQDILAYLHDHPELMTLNVQHDRNAGYRKSLARDAILSQKKGRL